MRTAITNTAIRSTDAPEVPTSVRNGQVSGRRKMFAALAVVVALAVPLSACSSSEDPKVSSLSKGAESAKPTDQNTLSAQEAEAKFASCMQENGVDLQVSDDGQSGSVSVGSGDASQVEKAMETCKEFLPDGGDVEPASPEELESARAFARCMREHGVDMADPDPETGGMIGLDATKQDPEKLDAANAACSSLMPTSEPSATK